MNLLSLFAGIGGLELGLERAGMTTVGQVEKDEYCQRVLAKHWPEVPRHDDVRTAVDWWLSESRPNIDLVCGGFPCQPFSSNGRRLGISDDRWGWPWMADVVRRVGPRYVLVENVPRLIADGDAFGRILSDLAACGYDAEWDCIPAKALGAPHERDRVFLVAHARGVGRREGPWQLGWLGPAERGASVADTERERRNRWSGLGAGARGWPQPPHDSRWLPEPAVGRVATGVPSRVDRVRALGNAVVPQVAEHVGRMIVAHHNQLTLTPGEPT